MRRRGLTLVELLIWMSLIAILVSLFVPSVAGWRDRLAVRRARLEIMAFYHSARHSAIVRGTRVRLRFAADSLVAVFEGVSDSVFLARPGPARRGVSLTASRSEIRIHPNGLGRAGANTKLVLRRGAAAESLTTSRLGRLRSWY
ncbi:MAG: prepilin-type N-terminal cleavage/methylation domain-containing protein [Gemmatimonadetes bacterium]|nr:prepilin-type N-terminal cleavage/methylation domain-containing protein [Gemmatimonadota bacterium]